MYRFICSNRFRTGFRLRRKGVVVFVGRNPCSFEILLDSQSSWE